MYRLATKRTGEKRVEENTSVSFFYTQSRVHWLIAHYFMLRTWEDRYHCSSRLSGLSSGAFI